jgi:hypothetical protein
MATPLYNADASGIQKAKEFCMYGGYADASGIYLSRGKRVLHIRR